MRGTNFMPNEFHNDNACSALSLWNSKQDSYYNAHVEWSACASTDAKNTLKSQQRFANDCTNTTALNTSRTSNKIIIRWAMAIQPFYCRGPHPSLWAGSWVACEKKNTKKCHT